MNQKHLFTDDIGPQSGARFSECRTWRYDLWRMWDGSKPSLIVIGLNPSTADEKKDDNTIRRCIRFAKRFGCGSYIMLNAYGLRSTDPKGLWEVEDPVGPDNDHWIHHHVSNHPKNGIRIAAWGGNIKEDRADEVLQLCMKADRPLQCFQINNDGTPKHPLYVASDKKLQPYISTRFGAFEGNL